MIFGSYEPVEAEVADERVEHALVQIKRNARNRRIAMAAPVALMAAILSAFVAAPQEHGGISLVPDAEASDDLVLPRVFGANGVWRFAEPIDEARPQEASPPSVNEVPVDPTSPSFSLHAPDSTSAAIGGSTGQEVPSQVLSPPSSLPVSASSPPTLTLGQSADAERADVRADIRVETPAEPAPAAEAEDAVSTDPVSTDPVSTDPVSTDPVSTDPVSTDPVADDPVSNDPVSNDPVSNDVAPDVSAPAETTTTPDNSSSDEDVAGPVIDDAAASAAEVVVPEASGESALDGDAAESGPEVNPSTPQAGSTEQGTQLSSAVATIVPGLVLVQRAHVSVTVQVVDDDSSVIDWCNTRVDWGDGSITGLPSPDGNVSCAAVCELDAIPSVAGAIDTEITFTHEYSGVIDAAPRVFVATGDGCSYSLAEYQLNPFTVVPY